MDLTNCETYCTCFAQKYTTDGLRLLIFKSLRRPLIIILAPLLVTLAKAGGHKKPGSRV